MLARCLIATVSRARDVVNESMSTTASGPGAGVGVAEGAVGARRDHAPVRLPGVLQTNVGHSNFRYVSFKKNHII